MSLLTIVQDAITVNGFGASPVAVFGNSESIVQQTFAIAREGLDTIWRSKDWQGGRYTATFTGPGLSSVLPNDFDHVVPDTSWDHSRKMRWEPVSAEEERTIDVATTVVVHRYYTIRQNYLFFVGVDSISADDTFSFQYQSAWPVKYFDTGINAYYRKLAFTADDDTTWFPERLLRLYTIWRLRKAKGFDYAEEFNEFERELSTEKGRNSPAKTINFGTQQFSPLTPGNFPATIETP